MTIGIDTRLYGTRHGGIGRYTEELIQNLLAIDPETRDYVFFVYRKEDEEQIQKSLPKEAIARVRCVLAPYRCYTFAEQIFMPMLIARAQVNLMHFTHFNVPLAYRAPFVVTIHDLIIHHFPDERATTLPKWLYKIKLRGYKKAMRHAVEKARAIISPSEATKRDILRFYAIDAKKIIVTYEGISMSSKLKIQSEKLQFKIQSYRPYLLYVGSFYPHKNIERLIDAFHILRTKYNLNLKLVIVGKKDYFQEQVEKYLTAHYQLLTAHRIFYGYAKDEELAALYQNASLYVFPSLYEGFGLPPLEAMSFGVPVIASNASCIPEICGNAALYFNPKNAEDIAAKIYLVYTQPIKQAELCKMGYAQIQKYSWQKTAEQTLQIYSRMV